jgi:hypothetical protein
MATFKPANEQNEAILQELLNLQDIRNNDKLKEAIKFKLDNLSFLERRTLDLKLGMKIKEPESQEIGLGAPSKRIKFISFLFFLTLSFLGIWLPFKYNLNMVFKIPILIFAFIWTLAALKSAWNLLTKN